MKLKYILSRLNDNSLFGPIVIFESPEGEWPDVFELLGPNSSGKSTMLNIIGVGCDGINNKKIHPSIIEKMNHLMNNDYYHLTFNIEFEDDNGTKLILEKLYENNPKINFYKVFNGTDKKISLSLEDFHKEYILIYDTPIDPIKRIQDLKREFGAKLGNILDKISMHKAYLRDIMSTADNKRIDNINIKTEEMHNKENVIGKLSKIIEINQGKLRIYECATYFYYRAHYKSQKEKIETEKEEVKQEIKSLGGDLISTDAFRRDARAQFKKKIDILKLNRNSVEPQLRALFPEDSYGMGGWEKLDFEKMESDLLADKEFRELIIHFISALDKMKKDNKNIIKESEACKDLKELCEKYRELDMSIPGTTLSFAEELRLVNQEWDQYRKLRANIGIMENCRQKLDVMKIDFDTLEQLIQNIDEMDRKAAINKENFYKIEEKKEDLGKLEKLLGNYNVKYIKYNSLILTNNVKENKNCKISDLEEFKTYSADRLEEMLMNVISQTKEHISNKSLILEDEIEKRNKMRLAMEKLKALPEAPYEKHIKELEKIFKVFENLEKILGQRFKIYLNQIGDYRDKKIDMAELPEEEKNFYNALFSYFAKVIGTIRYMGEDIEVIEMNLIRNTFTSKDGIVRNFLDMGSGESQLNYLISILDQEDNRKMIVLLDDIANIDFENMNKLKEKLRKLREEGRLLFGIIVQARQTKGPLEICKI